MEEKRIEKNERILKINDARLYPNNLIFYTINLQTYNKTVNMLTKPSINPIKNKNF